MYKHLPALIIVIAAFASGLIYLSNTDEGQITESNARDIKISQFDGDFSPKERALYEFWRLRDPKTNEIPSGIRNRSLDFMKATQAFHNPKEHNDRLLSEEWQPRGPYYIGGRTRALALDVTNENIILAGGVSGGMWRSVDGGTTWSRTTKLHQMQSVSTISQDKRPGKENIWYYGTGELWGNSSDLIGDGIFKSTDGGLSWNQLESTMSGTHGSWDGVFDYIWRVETDPSVADQDVVYCATALGSIQKSTDGGESWNLVLGGWGNNFGYFTELAISPNGVKYAALGKRAPAPSGSPAAGIYRSIDGEVWTNITPENWPEEYNRIVIGIAPSDEDQVYFLAETPGSGRLTFDYRGDSLWNSIWKYTYKSGDGSGTGGVWEDRSANIPKPESRHMQFNPQGSYNLVCKVKPNDPDVVFIGGTSLYRSNDGFATDNSVLVGGVCPFEDCEYWYRYPNHHSDLHEVVFLPSNPDVMFTGEDGGIHKVMDNTKDVFDWISLNTGYYTTQFYAISIDHAAENPKDILLGGMQDNGTLYATDNDVMNPWRASLMGDGFYCQVADGGTVTYSSNNTNDPVKIRIYRRQLANNGDTIVRRRIDPTEGKDFMWNTPFFLDPNDNAKMYVAGGKIVWRNNNLDEIPMDNSDEPTMINWDSLSNTRVEGTAFISAVAISKNPANVLYYGTSEGEVYKITDADKGNPVPELVYSDGTSTSNVGCIAIDPNDANKAIIVYTNYRVQSLLYTEDGGSTWTPVGGNLEETKMGTGDGPGTFFAKYLPIGDGDRIFLGTTTGLYSTSYLNGFSTVWELESPDVLGNVNVNMVDTRESDGLVVAGTHATGVYQANITSLHPTPNPIALTQPADGSKGIPSSVQVNWESTNVAAMYQLEVATDKDFNNIVHSEIEIQNNYAFVNGLEEGGNEYFWRVRVNTAGGVSEYSEVWSFITAPGAPELIFPEKSQKDVDTTVAFLWEEVNGASRYNLQIATKGGFNGIIVDTIVNETTCTIHNLEKNSKYYWKVASGDDEGFGELSKTSTFYTKDPSSVEDNSLDGLVLYQNYPNPFSRTTHIEFETTSAANAILELYSSDGKKIETLLNEMVYGRKRVDVQASKLDAGVYYYRLITSGKTYTKKMVVVK